nr:hypothetical protein [Amycolatopsis sp. MEP2-6]
MAEEVLGFAASLAVSADELAEGMKYLSAVVVVRNTLTDCDAASQLSLRSRQFPLSSFDPSYDVKGDGDLDAIALCRGHRSQERLGLRGLPFSVEHHSL